MAGLFCGVLSNQGHFLKGISVSLQRKFPKAPFVAQIEAEILFMAGFEIKKLKRIAGISY